MMKNKHGPDSKTCNTHKKMLIANVAIGNSGLAVPENYDDIGAGLVLA